MNTVKDKIIDLKKNDQQIDNKNNYWVKVRSGIKSLYLGTEYLKK